MKNSLSTKEQRILDDSFATLENCINNLAKNERLSLDNIRKAIHYTYDLFSEGRSPIMVGEPYEGKSHLLDFMSLIIQDESPATIWADVEEDVAAKQEEGVI